jgi:hypothetical protein
MNEGSTPKVEKVNVKNSPLSKSHHAGIDESQESLHVLNIEEAK